MSTLPKKLSDCAVALVYDRVTTQHGGAEKVLVALHQLFPEAPIFTSVYEQKKTNWANNISIIPSWLQKIPFANKNHRLLLPLLPLAFEDLDLSSFDVIISITSAEAKGVITQPHQLHICYMLTPTRYLYSHYQIYLKATAKIPGLSILVKYLFKYIRWWDQAAKTRPDVLIPISKLVASRISQYYQRKPAQVIYPPIEAKPLATHHPHTIPDHFNSYYLVVSRFVSYKKIDLAIKATQQLGKKLVLVGDGPQRDQLQNLIDQSSHPNNILLLPPQSDQEIQSLMHHAQGLLMPGIEDFGITALEALNQQTPAIVHQKSGVAELISHQKTGIHLKDLTVNGLIEAIELLESTSFSKKDMSEVVKKFKTSTFKQNIQQVLSNLWKEHYGKYT